MVKRRRLIPTLFFVTCSSLIIFVLTTQRLNDRTSRSAAAIKCIPVNSSSEAVDDGHHASELLATISSRIPHTSGLYIPISELATNVSKIIKNSSSSSSWKIDSTEDVCDDNDTFILAIVPSTVGNTNQRNYVRETWANKALFPFTRIKTVFFLASTTNSTVQQIVEEEAQKFKDIIQTHFIDAYRNLTYKTISSLTWVSENCKNVPWILKIDEDVVVNPFNLRNYLEFELRRNPHSELIYGRLRKHSRAWRKGKWNVTLNEYPKTYYPPFILGSAYIIGRSAVDKLVAYTKITPFFWLEDVYITGLVAEKAGIARKSIEYEYFQTRSSAKLYKGRAIFFIGASPRKSMLIWVQIAKLKPTQLKTRKYIKL